MGLFNKRTPELKMMARMLFNSSCYYSVRQAVMNYLQDPNRPGSQTVYFQAFSGVTTAPYANDNFPLGGDLAYLGELTIRGMRSALVADGDYEEVSSEETESYMTGFMCKDGDIVIQAGRKIDSPYVPISDESAEMVRMSVAESWVQLNRERVIERLMDLAINLAGHVGS